MKLRTRLIIAFLILSVVPLSAMTLVWYVSSVHTFERVAEREATETAADIGRRMEMVTANVGRRMDRLFDEAVGYQYRYSSIKTPSSVVEGRGPRDADARRHCRPRRPPGVPRHGRSRSKSRSRSEPERRARCEAASTSIWTPRRPPGSAAACGRGLRGHRAPRPPPPIVMDVPRIIEEARKAAKAGTASAGPESAPWSMKR